MSNINGILLKWEGFKYASSLDLNMGYYHIQLSEDTSNLCEIIIPKWKYNYKCLPTGVIHSQDIFQQKINDLFQGFEYICVYIEKLLIF